MNTWDHLTRQAHQLLTNPRRGQLTPAVTAVQSLHRELPLTPAAICSHLDTADRVLPRLAAYARNNDPNALLMAAVLMRHPLRNIAKMADPDGYCSTDIDARDNATLEIFFTLVRNAADPQMVTTRQLYSQTLTRVLRGRPKAGTPATAYRVDPQSPVLDKPCLDHYNYVAQLLQQALKVEWITALEHQTLVELYLNSGVNKAAAAQALGATEGAIERRAQRAIRKINLKLTQKRTQEGVAA